MAFCTTQWQAMASTITWTPANGDGVSYFSPLNWIDSSTGAAPATGIVAIGVTLNRDIVIQNTVQPVGGSGIGADVLVGDGTITMKNATIVLSATKFAGIKQNSGKTFNLDNSTCQTEYIDGSTIIMSNGSGIVFYGADALRSGATIQMNSANEYLSFQAVSRADVISKYLPLITIQGKSAALNSNVLVYSNGAGAVVAPAVAANPTPVTLYSGYNFGGDSVRYANGLYNGTLGTFDNKAVSFKLAKGYMLTVAQNVLGTGVSKVYIASKADLAINLPAALQKSISFLRVSPWHTILKKGGVGKGNDVIEALNVSWFYDWGASDVSTDTREYVPMNWGGSVTQSNVISWGANMSFTHHLAFNEPDGPDQANMTVDAAILKYPLLQASGLRLGAPAVTDGARGATWRDDFMKQALDSGYRIDFIPVHYYKRASASSFYTWLKAIYDKYHLPIWVTEFNYGGASADSIALTSVYNGLKAYINMLDTTSFIERYSVFTFQPPATTSLMSKRTPVTLNISGEFYRDKASTIGYIQENYVQGPNPETAIEKHTNTPLASVANQVVTNGILRLNLKTAGRTISGKLWVSDLSGRVVLMSQITSGTEKVNVSDLKNGVYVLSVIQQGSMQNCKFMVR